MDVGNATIIAAAIAAAVSLGSSVFAWCAGDFDVFTGAWRMDKAVATDVHAHV